jgi:uncharacterized damage-inducible protein DinB
MEKWFDRGFAFSFGTERYSEIYGDLLAGPDRLREAFAGLAEPVQVYKPDGGWSIREHAGHLSVLEPIWRVRFHDILNRVPVLTPADLTNRATTEANFNSRSVAQLIADFTAERAQTIDLLGSIDMLDVGRTSLHPRLQQPMRLIDLAYFVAEHDSHHIARIKALSAV